MKFIKPIVIVFLLICSSSFGQTGKLKRADRLFDSFSFTKAIDKYENVVNKNESDSYAMRKLGDSYMYLRMPEKAVEVYKKIVNIEGVPGEYYFKYAQALRGVGKYEESKIWMEKYKKIASSDSRTLDFIEKNKAINAMFNVKRNYTISAVNFNTEYSDFGAMDFNNDILFSSSRDNGVAVKRKYAWNMQPFLDVYKIGQGAPLDSIKKIEGDINTKYHEGPLTLSSDGTRMYFSRNNYFEGDKGVDTKGVSNLKIYRAELVNGVWTNIKGVHINNDNYSVSHPTLSKDGKKLYYASDVPGGIGGTDIYVIDVNEDGSLGTPVNMGNVVNTEGDEMFPFIHDEGTLFFASDGHVGFGLLDIFATITGDNNEIVNVLNLGAPINSEKDDFAYFLNEDGLNGYISSNRDGGKGDDDIYKFNRKPALILEVYVYDEVNKKPLANSKVDIKNDSGQLLVSLITDANGLVKQEIDRDVNLMLFAAKEKYTSGSKPFNSFNKENEVEMKVSIGLNPIEDVVVLADLDIIYFDLDKSFIRPDAALELDKVVNIMNEYPGMIIRLESHTDSRAPDMYNIKLSERRAKSTYDYIISKGINPERITKYEGFGETQLVNKCSNGVKCSKDEHQLNRRTEFVILKMK